MLIFQMFFKAAHLSGASPTSRKSPAHFLPLYRAAVRHRLRCVHAIDHAMLRRVTASFPRCDDAAPARVPRWTQVGFLLDLSFSGSSFLILSTGRGWMCLQFVTSVMALTARDRFPEREAGGRRAAAWLAQPRARRGGVAARRRGVGVCVCVRAN